MYEKIIEEKLSRCAVCGEFLPLDKNNIPNGRVFIDNMEICIFCFNSKKHLKVVE